MRDAPLRIALLTHSVNPRGGVVHTIELAEALQAAGHAVTVMAPAVPGERLFRDVGCALDLVGVAAGATDTGQMIRMRIAAFVEHLAGVPRGPAGRRAFRRVPRARRDRRECAGVAVRQRPDSGLRAHGASCRSLWRSAARCTAGEGDPPRRQGHLCQQPVARHAPGKPWDRRHGHRQRRESARFSPVAQAADRLVAERLGLVPGAPLIVCVGGIERRKNTLRILQAFQRLRCALPRAQLGVIGGASLLDHTAYRESFAAAVEAGGLRTGPGQDVVITGPVPDADMPAIMRLADAVAFPSVTEGFGLVALEALASGTPTVVSRIAPFTEYLSEGDVLWADPLDVQSIAAALREAVSRPKFAPPAVCERCSWSDSAARHVALYRH